MDIKPVTLIGNFICLVPLDKIHVKELFLAGQDPEIWRYMLYGQISSEEQMRAMVMELLYRQKQGTDLPFTVILVETGRPIGMTRYLDIRSPHRSLEIGGTWYQPAYQRTAVNTECKYLLLRHAFETLDCIRVQFKTDRRNERSQRALERIGAVKEGVLRSHMITPEGFIRDSVYYSILKSEWPDIKRRLESFIDR